MRVRAPASGYIQKYNDPPVHAFLSICHINAGVAAFPMCAPSVPVVGKVCLAFNEVLGELAYNALVQGVLFQANYWRDPTHLNHSGYVKHSQLAQWNGGESAARRPKHADPSTPTQARRPKHGAAGECSRHPAGDCSQRFSTLVWSRGSQRLQLAHGEG